MGISAIIGAIVGAVETAGAAIATFGAEAAGVFGITGAAAADIGLGLEGAVAGAGLGAVEGLVTHGNIGQDALLGGLTGGLIGGLGPELGALTGLGTTAGDALAGAGAGALGAELTHQNPLTGALEGGAAGALSGLIGGAGHPGAPTSSAGGAGAGLASAAAAAAPPGVPVSAPDISLGDTLAATPSDALSGVGAGLSAGAANAGAPSALAANVPGAVGIGAAAPAGASTPGLSAVAPASGVGGAGASTPDISLGGASISNAPDIASSINGGVSTGPASAATGVAPASAGSGISGILKNAPSLLGVGALGLDVLKGNQKPAYEAQLAAEAAALSTQGRLLQNYQTSGTLPPGMQAGINAAQDSAAAAIRSQYGSRGDAGSSAEAQDISNLGIRTQAQGESEAAALYQQGLSDTQLSDQLYSQLMQVQIAQDQQLSSGIGNLVSALASMGRPVAAAA
jgi:hypothetical protein